MENKLTYTNHIKHYITDAEVSDYFKPSKVEMYNIRRRYQYFKTFLKLKDRDKLCEIGSGGGEALNILTHPHMTYFPVDLSHKNLKIILDRAAKNTCPVTADIFTLPFKDAVFDKLILSEVLEHLHTPTQALAEIQRILKPGGLAVISVPNKEKIKYQLCIHCNQLTPSNAHLHSFDDRKLSGLAKDAGFTVKKAITFGNKLGNMLQLGMILIGFPFFIWRFLDSLLNLFIPKKSHLLIVISK